MRVPFVEPKVVKTFIPPGLTLCHLQPRTPVIVDNRSAQGLIAGTITPKKTKGYDTWAAWLKCRGALKKSNLISTNNDD